MRSASNPSKRNFAQRVGKLTSAICLSFIGEERVSDFSSGEAALAGLFEAYLAAGSPVSPYCLDRVIPLFRRKGAEYQELEEDSQARKTTARFPRLWFLPRRRIPAKLIEHVIAKKCQRPRSEFVDGLHRAKKPRVTRDPGFSSAGWYGDSDPEPLLQREPWRECTLQFPPPVIHHGKIPARKPCRRLAPLQPPECKIHSSAQQFCRDLSGTDCAKHNQHRRRIRFQKLRQSARNGAKFRNTIQRREVREDPIEQIRAFEEP